MQEPEAEDHVEELVELIEVEGVQASIRHLRPKQLPDRPKSLAALQLDAPPGRDPFAVLLVVDRQHPRGPASLRQERVEAVKRPDVQHAPAGKVLGQRGDAIAMVTRYPRR